MLSLIVIAGVFFSISSLVFFNLAPNLNRRASGDATPGRDRSKVQKGQNFLKNLNYFGNIYRGCPIIPPHPIITFERIRILKHDLAHVVRVI